MPPLSSKFGDIYPLSGYEDGSVVRSSLNGLHNEVNGEGEKASLNTGVSNYDIINVLFVRNVCVLFPYVGSPVLCELVQEMFGEL